MKYAGINFNDFSAAPGVSLTVFAQGCPHRCEGCHNPETWDFNGGKEFTLNTFTNIINGINANNIQRSLCIMGGEPLCPENSHLTYTIVSSVKNYLPETPIYIWTGYLYEDLQKSSDVYIKNILQLTDFLIDGPYKKEERDITLKMRGSRNQRIINLTKER